MMTYQRSAKAAKSPVKPDEKPRQSPADPAEVPWQARRKRRRDNGPSLRRQEQYLGFIASRIKELDEKIPASMTEFDDRVHAHKFAAFEIRALKQRKRWGCEKIADIQAKIRALDAELSDAVAAQADTEASLRVARADYNDTYSSAKKQRIAVLTMVDDRALLRRVEKQNLNRVDSAFSRRRSPEPFLLNMYIKPVEQENTDDDLPDDCDDAVGPDPDDYYVPSTPDYEVQ